MHNYLHVVNSFFNDVFQLHQAIGLIEVVVGCFGVGTSFFIRRPTVFRIKLGMVYLIVLLAGLGGVFLDHSLFHHIQHTFTSAFMIMISILYWREVKDYMTTEGFHRKCLGQYINNVPDLIWIKDIDHKYTYANKAMVKTLGIPLCDILGSDDVTIKEKLAERNVVYDINPPSLNGDGHPRNAKILIKSGYIGDRFIALQIYKGPLYSTDPAIPKHHVGYIGIGRDLTYDVEDHNAISCLLAKGKHDEAMKIFEFHKRRYENHNGNQEISFLPKKY